MQEKAQKSIEKIQIIRLGAANHKGLDICFDLKDGKKTISASSYLSEGIPASKDNRTLCAPILPFTFKAWRLYCVSCDVKDTLGHNSSHIGRNHGQSMRRGLRETNQCTQEE
jgi:hypothetical protein